jgi:hypothetical protein
MAVFTSTRLVNMIRGLALERTHGLTIAPAGQASGL